MLLLFFAVAAAFVLGTAWFRNPAPGFILAIIVWIIVGRYSCTVINKGDEKYAVRDTVDIQSAVTGSRIEGNFVLGSGTIKGKRYYAFWTSQGTHRKSAIERRLVKGQNWDVEVIQTDSVDSKIIFTEYKKKETALYVYLDSDYQRAEIFVPEGSVRYNYNLKAK
jgi:hypothetical protein